MGSSNYWSGRRVSRRGLVASAGALGAVAFVGCGDDDDKKPSATTAASSPSAAASGSATAPAGSASPAAEQPRKGGTLVWPNGGEPSMLDIHKNNNAYSSYYGSGNAYSGLIRPKATGHKGATIAAADLAETWEQPDKTTYVFKIRGNAKWQNIAPLNGRLLTADDIVYSFQRQISEKVNGSSFQGLKSLTAPDKNTVKIELEGPNVDFLGTLTGPLNKIVSKEAVELKGDLVNGPIIGTGPFIFKEWVKGSVQRLVRNPDYFIPTLPYLDAIEMPLITDAANWEAQFNQGKAHWLPSATAGIGVPIKTVKALDTKKYGLWRSLPGPTITSCFDTRAPMFKDPRIRKALAMAMDKDLISQTVWDGELQPAGIRVLLPGTDWLLPKEDRDKLQPFDPKAAKQMLEAAGGVPKQPMLTYESPSSSQTAQVVQANWKAVGFETELKLVDAVGSTQFLTPSQNNFTVATTAFLGGPNLTGDLELTYLTNGARNVVHLSDPDLDRMIKAQKEEFDEKARRTIVNDIQRRGMDLAWYIPSGALGAIYAYPLTVHNLEATLGYGGHFIEMWLSA